MNKFIGIRLILAILLVFNNFTFTVAADKNLITLDNVKVEGNSVIISLSAEAKYNAFTISNPPRIVIEFTNTEHNIKQKELEVNKTPIKRIRSGQFQNEPVKIARVVVDLDKTAEYEVKGNANVVTLSIISQAAESKEKEIEITEIATNKVVAKEDTKPPVKKTAATKAKAEKTKPKTPPKKAVTTPVKAAPAAAVATSKTSKAEDPSKDLKAKKTTKTKKTTTKKKVTKKEEPIKKSGVVLPSSPVTIDFEEADIRDVLRVLSMKSGINIIYDPDIEGTVTIRLENVPFDKALETILSIHGFVSQEQGPNILRVTTSKKIAEERSQAVTFTKVFPLNYAEAKDVQTNLNSVRTAEGRKGNITVDERTNSLIVTDTPEGLKSIERLIKELDKKPQQVLIEAKIVEVVLTDLFDMGIQWQYAGTPVNTNSSRVDVGKSDALSGTVIDGGDTGGLTQRDVKTIGDGGAGVAFPAAPAGGQAGSISFGIISNNNYLTGVLTTLSQKGLSKILSTPKVTTINNKEARILVGQKVPYTTATTISASGSTSSTQFLDVGIKMTVTPTINVDNRITLQVHPEVSLFVRADPAGPVLGTREAETTVLVENNQTVVIGGLITEEDRKLGTQVPLLGDLPVIGHLFRRDYKSKERTELLVFITPQIIE